MKRFLWYLLIGPFAIAVVDLGFRNNHFAAVASDQPALEVYNASNFLDKVLMFSPP